MSASPIDKKRRWMESSDGSSLSNDTSTISRPPLKKRFTANGKISISTPSQTTSDQPSSSSSTTLISPQARDEQIIAEHEQLPKDVLVRRMRSTKDEVNTLETQIEQLNDQCKDLEVYRSVIRIQWNMLQNDILIFSRALVDVNNNAVQDIPSDELDNDRLGQELHKSRTSIRDIGMRLLDFIRLWMKRSDQLDIQNGQSQVHQWVREEIQQLRTSYDKSRSLSKEMEQRYQHLFERSNNALNEIRTKEEQLDQAEEGLYEYTEKLAQAEKRYDRIESKSVAALVANGFITGKQESATQNDESPVNNIPPTPITAAAATTTTTTTTTTQLGETVETETGAQNETRKIQEQQLIVDTRVKELEDLRRERQSLLDDMDRLQNEFGLLSAEKLMTTEYYKTLELSVEHYRSRELYLTEMKSQLIDELREIKLERKKFEDDIDSEKKAQRVAMDNETERLETALARIKKQRDDYQLRVNDYMNKKEREKQDHDQTMKDIDNEADHISRLETQLSSLRTLIKSCEQGNAENPLNETVKAFGKLYTRLNNAKATVRYLEQKLNPDPTRATNENDLNPGDVELLRQRLAFWIEGSGQASVTDMYKTIKTLMAKVDEQAPKAEKLQLLVDFFQKNESQLMTQIDRAGAIFTQLEEQSSKAVFDLSHLNEQKNKLEAEKFKFGHTFANLKMHKDTNMEMVIESRRTSEQQVQSIRDLEGEVKDLETEIHDKESKCRHLVESLEDRRTDVEDLQHQCNELRIQLEHSDHFLHELQGMVKDKTRVLDEEKQLRKKVEDDYSKMQRKWNLTAQGESPEEEQLAEECEELRMLLKCGACHNHIRTRILARCMHTFCKQCIDTRLETRQRRCPTCSEPFGVSDVRQFFL
ncbi:hypothetical protein BDA99DRAFT_509197 [Phascolomyces articulosus]|uniref:E3 ubiquitin protein ligase n=1 Tax=Phascolomyces articulosus TaxID=60185 RepID=A0AAD5K1M8_9FUNG|nr:hypothetical protein BDA99DRAFT_509197 [Phascolomyces articulosus]